MPEDIKLLSSRRAYEFGPDELRLTVLSMAAVQEHIKRMFQFQFSAIGQPQETFGPVPATLPPGVVFDFGTWASPDGLVVPIRLLHFEQRRIVFDVAGPSHVIDQIFAKLTEFLSGATAPADTPVIGTPQHIREYSEIVAKFRFALTEVFAPRLQDLFARVVGTANVDHTSTLVPWLAMQALPSEEEYPGRVLPNPRTFQLDVRAGTRPDEHIYFSTAPLDSQAHLQYLSELEKLLAR